MIKINNYKLTPAITATWGDITGDVRNQEDLVEYIKENGTASWGNISGDISDQKDLMNTLEGYATESWVNDQGYLTSTSLTGYATESWVENKGYLTSTSLTGYATESWVENKGYLTEHQDLSDYALKSEIPSLDGYATEEWVNNQLSNYTTNSDFTSLQNRVVALETNYGDALNITNQILG